jgi:hypothetical protein
MSAFNREFARENDRASTGAYRPSSNTIGERLTYIKTLCCRPTRSVHDAVAGFQSGTSSKHYSVYWSVTPRQIVLRLAMQSVQRFSLQPFRRTTFAVCPAFCSTAPPSPSPNGFKHDYQCSPLAQERMRFRPRTLDQTHAPAMLVAAHRSVDQPTNRVLMRHASSYIR